MTPSRSSSRLSPYLLLTLTPLFWAGNFVVGRAIRNDVPPIALAFWRWAIAALLLLPFAWPHLRGRWPLIRRQWRSLTLFSVLGVVCFNVFAYLGLQYTTATNGVLLNSAIPILIIALNAIFLGNRPTPMQATGVALSLAGVLVIVAQGDIALFSALTLNAGDVSVLAAVLAWAVYTILLKQRPMDLHPLAFLAVLTIIGVIVLLPLYLMELASGRHLILSGKAAMALAYVAIFPALLGYVFWNRGVAAVGPNRAGLFIHLMPVFGTLLSVLLLGERPKLFQIAGIGLIFMGIALTTRRKAGVFP